MGSKTSKPSPSTSSWFGGVSRRGFLKSIGASAAALGAAGLSRGATPVDEESPQGPGAGPVTLHVNGQRVDLLLEPRVTLLEALRMNIGLTGTKEACDRASCGSCTVLLDGLPVNACSLLAIDVQGCEITTVEGLVGEAEARSLAGLPMTGLQRALVEQDGLQCGYCTPGFVMTLTALLRRNPHPSEAEVKEACAGNFCRCGSYPRIFAAAMAASGQAVPSRLTVITLHDHDHALA